MHCQSQSDSGEKEYTKNSNSNSNRSAPARLQLSWFGNPKTVEILILEAGAPHEKSSSISEKKWSENVQSWWGHHFYERLLGFAKTAGKDSRSSVEGPPGTIQRRSSSRTKTLTMSESPKFLKFPRWRLWEAWSLSSGPVWQIRDMLTSSFSRTKS